METDVELQKIYEKRVTVARWALLLTALFSAINLAWVVYDGTFSFIATAAIPELLAHIEIILYLENAPLFWQIVCVGATVVLLLFYTLCGLISKQRRGWLVTGSILFFVDYVVRLYFLYADLLGGRDDLGMILIRILIPTVLLILLILGLGAYGKLKKKA